MHLHPFELVPVHAHLCDDRAVSTITAAVAAAAVAITPAALTVSTTALAVSPAATTVYTTALAVSTTLAALPTGNPWRLAATFTASTLPVATTASGLHDGDMDKSLQ